MSTMIPPSGVLSPMVPRSGVSNMCPMVNDYNQKATGSYIVPDHSYAIKTKLLVTYCSFNWLLLKFY